MPNALDTTDPSDGLVYFTEVNELMSGGGPMAPAITDSVNEDTQQAQEAGMKPVTVHVNERPVVMPRHRSTGLGVKTTAIEQGVSIEEDFILVEEFAHGRTKVIGDSDVVHLGSHSRFLANDGDDNA
jgi:hypothetical protein